MKAASDFLSQFSTFPFGLFSVSFFHFAYLSLSLSLFHSLCCFPAKLQFLLLYCSSAWSQSLNRILNAFAIRFPRNKHTDISRANAIWKRNSIHNPVTYPLPSDNPFPYKKIQLRLCFLGSLVYFRHLNVLRCRFSLFCFVLFCSAQFSFCCLLFAPLECVLIAFVLHAHTLTHTYTHTHTLRHSLVFIYR